MDSHSSCTCHYSNSLFLMTMFLWTGTVFSIWQALVNIYLCRKEMFSGFKATCLFLRKKNRFNSQISTRNALESPEFGGPEGVPPFPAQQMWGCCGSLFSAPASEPDNEHRDRCVHTQCTNDQPQRREHDTYTNVQHSHEVSSPFDLILFFPSNWWTLKVVSLYLHIA